MAISDRDMIDAPYGAIYLLAAWLMAWDALYGAMISRDWARKQCRKG